MIDSQWTSHSVYVFFFLSLPLSPSSRLVIVLDLPEQGSMIGLREVKVSQGNCPRSPRMPRPAFRDYRGKRLAARAEKEIL
jgi:hypothetical protein